MDAYIRIASTAVFSLLIFIIQSFFVNQFNLRKTIFAIPNKRNMPLTIFTVLCEIVFTLMVLYLIYDLYVIWTVLSKSGVFEAILMAVIVLLTIVIVLYSMLSIYRDYQGINIRTSKINGIYPTVTLGSEERVWIVKPLESDIFLCVSSKKNFKDNKYAVISKNDLIGKVVSYSEIDEKTN